EKAIRIVEALDDFGSDDRARLWETLGQVIWHTRGSVPEMAAAFRKALEMAEAQRDGRAELRSLWGIAVSANANAEYPEAMARLERFARLAGTLNDPVLDLRHHRLAALLQHYAGRHRQSRRHAECLLEDGTYVGQSSQNILQFDRRVTAHSMLARDLFL